MITDKNLDLWVANNLNVLMVGGHGIGKTAITKAAFNRNKLNWLYFSASTMDPWVDMIGVPKEVTDDKGNRYLDLVRPKAFQFDEIDAIFFDELNRAPKKVRNAVMELMQFKSINGHKFERLRMVWGAINPEDDEGTYDVERLDPAQKDRFQIHVTLPETPNRQYFAEKFGGNQANSAIEWWQQSHKKMVSPRRLDYALEVYNMGLSLKDVLPNETNPDKLRQMLGNGVAREKLLLMMERGQIAEAEAFLAQENVYAEVIDWMIEKPEVAAPLYKLLSPEKITALITENYKNDKVLAALTSDYYANKRVKDTVHSLQNSTKDTFLRKAIYNSIPKLQSTKFGTQVPTWTPRVKTNPRYNDMVTSWVKTDKALKTTKDRSEIFDAVMDVPEDISIDNAKVCLQQLLTSIKKSHKKTIQDSPQIFGPLNFLLQKTNMNMATESFVKMHANKITEAEMEHLVWIPSTK